MRRYTIYKLSIAAAFILLFIVAAVLWPADPDKRLVFNARKAVEVLFTVCAVLLTAAYLAIYLISAKLGRQMEIITEAEKLISIGRLSANIAHEINNPLANASLNIEMLKNDFDAGATDDNFRTRLDDIESDLDRVSSITKELLQFSRTKDPVVQSLNINGVINASLNLMRNRLQYITVHKHIVPTPEIEGDQLRLEQVVINLLNNAAEAVANGGDITISTRHTRRWVIVEIADTGIGIESANKSRVFDPFFTTKEVGKGTGLGLSIAYGIIKQHNGTITLISEKGKGTRAIIKLPSRRKVDDKAV